MKCSYDICIVGGLGHVGLPLGICLADAGKKVVLYDVNKASIDIVSKGKMPFMEDGAEQILGRVLNKNLFLTSDKKTISDSRFIIIALGTPVDEHLNPDFKQLNLFFSESADLLRDDQHIIIRSTVFPGTTKRIYQSLQSCGKKIKVSFCPERIAEGKAIEELRTLPQIVASFDDDSLEEAKKLFSLLTPEIIVLSPMEAELAKLFTNVWRYIQFAISNQFYQIASQNGLDFYKIYDAISYRYPRAKGLAGAGFAAGPCLFKDTMQLAAYSNNNFFLGHAAMLVNEGLPDFIILNLKQQCALSDKAVGILGMAFKADSDDTRESLSYKLRKGLQREAKCVLCTDPFVRDDTLLPLGEVVTKSDVIILGAPHSAYKQLKFDNSKIVVDIWGFWRKGDKLRYEIISDRLGRIHRRLSGQRTARTRT